MVVLLLAASPLARAQDSLRPRSTRSWILSAEQAKQQLRAGALLLDARGRIAWLQGHLQGAIPVRWQDFSRKGASERGLLLEDLRVLEARISQLGVRNDRPVVVVGDPLGGWGEEGRIVWMLRTLGHRQVAFVDGGMKAMLALGWSLTRERSEGAKGKFKARWRRRWSIGMEELRQRMASKGKRPLSLIDARSDEEFGGATVHGQTRGGHLPGALPLHYRSLMDDKGFLLPRKKLIRRMAELDIYPSEAAVAYCTGGVRSAWLSAVLLQLGFVDVRNYAGSTWEWAAADATTHPLVGGK